MLRLISISILFAACLSSCSTDRILFLDPSASRSFTYEATKGVYFSMPSNDRLVSQLVSEGVTKECASKIAYDICDVQMKRNLPNRCHHQFLKFNTVDAVENNGSLSITLGSKNNRVHHNIKTIKVEIVDNNYTVDIFHGKGEIEEIFQNDGSSYFSKVKKSHISKEHITLDKDHYMKGDTIHGSVSIEAYSIDGMGRPTKEYVKGEFRTIVGGYEDCAFSYKNISRNED